MILVAHNLFLIHEFVIFIAFYLSIAYLGKIRDISYYAYGGLILIPITFLSAFDNLIFFMVVTIYYYLIRKLWKQKYLKRNFELLALLEGIAINIVSTFFSSYLIKDVIQPRLNIRLTYNISLEIILYDVVLAILLTVVMTWVVNFYNKKITISNSTEVTILNTELTFFIIIILLVIKWFFSIKMLSQLSNIVLLVIFAQFILTLFVTLVAVKKYRKRNEMIVLKKQMKIMSLYNHEIEQNYQEMRKFKHDLKNILSSLKINNQESNSYLKKVEQYLHPFQNKKIDHIINLENLKLQSLKMLIITKIMDAKAKGITIAFECIRPVESINLNEVDLNRIIGILFDNAIEATQNTTDKEIHILVIKHNDSVEFTIENSFSGEVNLDKIKKLGYTTKQNNQGIGLSNLSRLVDKYMQLSFAQYVENKLFVSTLIIEDK